MINLEVGKSYKNRKGEVVKIIKFVEESDYPFLSSNEEYTKTGRFYLFGEDLFDLIEEVADETKAIVEYSQFIFNDKTSVKITDKVKFLGNTGSVVDARQRDDVLGVQFGNKQTLYFGSDKKLLGFDSENLLEIIKDEYQVLYRNNHGIYNTTTIKVTNMKEAIGVIEYDNERDANPKKVVGLIDKNGNIIYNNKENV